MPLPGLEIDRLAALHLEVLYVWVDGRIAGTRGGGPSPPLLHLLRTSAGNHWALHEHERSNGPLADALAAEPVVTVGELELRPPTRVPVALRERGGEQSREYRGPAFVCPSRPAARAGPMLIERVADVPPGLRGPLGWISELTERELPAAVVIEDGVVLSVCHCARSVDEAAEAGVDTVDTARRQGLGRAVVATWAAAMIDRDRRPLYSTTWDNDASRALATSLGFEMYGEDYHVS